MLHLVDSVVLCVSQPASTTTTTTTAAWCCGWVGGDKRNALDKVAAAFLCGNKHERWGLVVSKQRLIPASQQGICVSCNGRRLLLSDSITAAAVLVLVLVLVCRVVAITCSLHAVHACARRGDIRLCGACGARVHVQRQRWRRWGRGCPRHMVWWERCHCVLAMLVMAWMV